MKLLNKAILLLLLSTMCSASRVKAQTVLVGTKTIGTNADSDAAGQAEAFKKPAAVSGTVNLLTVYLNANSATQVYVGLYSHNTSTNSPASLLTSGVINSPVNGWNSVSVPAVNVTANTMYWLAIMGTGGTVGFVDKSSCAVSQSSSQTTLTSLPGTWSTGTVYQDCYISLYGSNGGVQVSISVAPTSATVIEGGSQQYNATVSGTTNTGVNWSVLTGTGSVNNSGLFTAPNHAETDTIQAQSQADTTKTATASGIVPAVGISIAPTSVTLAPNGQQQFTPTITGTINTAVMWAEVGNGSVTNTGFYTAPAAAENDTVKVTSQADSTKSATANITVQQAIAHQVSLTWSETDTGDTFNMYRSNVSGSGYTNIISGLSNKAYTDASVKAGQTYYYVVTSVNSYGESKYSNEFKAVVPTP